MDLYSGANCNVSEISGVISPAYANLRSKGSANSKFYDYYFKTQYWAMAMFAHGKGVSYDNRWTINNDSIKNYEIPVPSYSEQVKIVDIINSNIKKIDRLVNNQEQQIEKLKAYKQSLITEVVTKGLNPDAPMKDSGVEWIGKINSEHIPYKLKNIIPKEKDSIRVGPFGSAIKGSDIIPNGHYWIYNQRVVLDNDFNSTSAFVTDNKFQELCAFEVKNGDILCTTRGSIGHIARVPENYYKGIIHPCIIRFRIDDTLVIYELLELIFNYSDMVVGQLKNMSNATTIDVVYSDSLKQVVIPLGSLEIQKQLLNYLKPKCSYIDQLIEIKQQKIEKLNEYKKSLIYEYVTGKKEVI